MDWSYREKMHRIAMACASAANMSASGRCHDAPNHIELERQRRLMAKKSAQRDSHPTERTTLNTPLL